MTQEYNKVYMLNFNCTFGDTNEELLTHFIDYFYPAIKSGIKRELPDEGNYSISSVLIQDIPNTNRKVLTGLLTHKTILRNTAVPEGSKYKRVDNSYPAYPSSIFVLFLDNHKLAYVPLQKGSPKYTQFSATLKYILKVYKKNYNKNRSREEHLPYAYLNIEPLPSKEKISEHLRRLIKIQILKIKLFPLNHTVDPNEAVSKIRDLYGETGSKNTQIISTTLTNKEKTAEIIEGATPYATVTVTGIDENGSKVKFTNDSFKSEADILINTNTDYINDNIDEIVKITSKFPLFSDVQPQQKKSYNAFLTLLAKIKNL